MKSSVDKILIIKHGALGDIILATAPMLAIRKKFPDSKIHLLTTKPYADLLSKSGWFDEIIIDNKPKLHNILAITSLMRKIAKQKYDFIFDLQTSSRTKQYFYLLKILTNFSWSGHVKSCSHPQLGKDRAKMHTYARHRDQLAIAGVLYKNLPDISWLEGDVSHIKPTKDYGLIVAGGAAHRPEKRWHKEGYIDICKEMIISGIIPLLIGGNAERDLLEEIAVASGAVNLCGKTDFGQIATLARGALFALGNDTGPMHLIAATGCKSFVLFSNASDPKLSCPVGDHVYYLQDKDLHNLSSPEVKAWMSELI